MIDAPAKIAGAFFFFLPTKNSSILSYKSIAVMFMRCSPAKTRYIYNVPSLSVRTNQFLVKSIYE
jgi:hypothetical protein